MNEASPEPTVACTDRAAVLMGYLDYFRARTLDKVSALPEDEQGGSWVPSVWTPLQLLKHLTFVEHRWLEWGFLGEASPDPWGDERDDRWFVAEQELFADLDRALDAQGERTRAIVVSHELDEQGQPGPRWDGAPPATLKRVLLHLIQEYARHLGHIDIATELASGATGE